MADGAFQGAASGAASGAMVGSVVPGIGTAVGAGVGGLIGLAGGKGADQSARAAQNAAVAQQREAAAQRGAILTEGRAQQAGAMDLAQATPQELQAYDRQLQSSLSQLEQREKMIAAIDPALMEASEQVLALLRGEQAGSTKVQNDQRTRQRQQLVNQIRSQYGPGAESSSIGRRMLDQFDAETGTLTQQSQQNALSQVFGIAGSAPQLTDRNSALSALNQAGNNFGNLQNRQLGAYMQTGSNILSGLAGTAQPMINTAGAQYTGDLLRGQYQQQLAGSLMEGGITAGMGMMNQNKDATKKEAV